MNCLDNVVCIGQRRSLEPKPAAHRFHEEERISRDHHDVWNLEQIFRIGAVRLYLMTRLQFTKQMVKCGV